MLRSILFLAVAVSTTSPAFAAAPEAWANSAMSIVGAYEGKGFGQVTADTDCQGLSLGMEQSTVQSGSLLRLVDLIPADEFSQGVAEKMPTIGQTFLRIVELLRRDDLLGAREEALKVQVVEKSNRCEGGRRGTKVQQDAARELEAWLVSEPVKRAQIKFAREKLDRAFRHAECFMRETYPKQPLDFRHFLFFYGFLVQAGERGLSDSSLENATSLVSRFQNYGVSEQEHVKRKVEFLSDWFKVQWSNTSDPRYFADAAKNSAELRTLADTFSLADVHLLFIRHVRAITGNTPYQLIFMARGLIDLTGRGWINGQSFDHRKQFSALGTASGPDRKRISCTK